MAPRRGTSSTPRKRTNLSVVRHKSISKKQAFAKPSKHDEEKELKKVLPSLVGTRHPENQDPAAEEPRSFVFRRGVVDSSIRLLVKDLRKVMSPNASMKLQERTKNSVKDFLAVASIFEVSHFIIVTQSSQSTYIRFARVPRGPTLVFRVESFSLMKDVRAAQRKPRRGTRDFVFAPLVVMNGFKGDAAAPMKRRRTMQSVPLKSADADVSPRKLTSAMVMSMFPAMDVMKTRVTNCRRVVLFDARDEDTFELRHYSVVRRPAATGRAVRKLLRQRLNPNAVMNLGNQMDIADVVLTQAAGIASDSEVEDLQEVEIKPEKELDRKRKHDVMKRVTDSTNKIAVGMVELGPRLTLSLVKVEEEVCTGKVIYHQHVKKTAEEIQALDARSSKLKAERRSRVKKFDDAVLRKEELRAKARLKKKLLLKRRRFRQKEAPKLSELIDRRKAAAKKEKEAEEKRKSEGMVGWKEKRSLHNKDGLTRTERKQRMVTAVKARERTEKYREIKKQQVEAHQKRETKKLKRRIAEVGTPAP